MDLSSTDLSRVVSFDMAIMHNTTWPAEALLLDVSFNRTDLSRSTFGEGTILDGASFVSATLYRVNFKGASLRRANFEDANLTDTDFTGANLGEANLEEANMTRVVFDKTTDFSQANLRETIYAGMTLRNIDFTQARLVRSGVHGCRTAGRVVRQRRPAAGGVRQGATGGCKDS